MGFSGYLIESAKILELTRDAISDESVANACDVIAEALLDNKPLLVCGNGGSAADAMHITGEFVGRFLLERRALNVICLCDNAVVLTAWSNDYSYETIFARQVEAYGKSGAVLLGISTSGNSRNVVAAFEQARVLSMTTIAFTGQGGGKLASLSDHLFAVPSICAPLIQQVHVCLYHYLCQRVESALAPGSSKDWR
ncbi:MAG: D-sedoheptulose-7-phosphate isomerase [Bryobacteraceae bacterium]